MTKNSPIYVTKPYLPPFEELIPYLETIWRSGIVTNNGPFHDQLEDALAKYLGVKYISLFTNATIALITALQALKISGEVITTPFSFVATSHSLLWNNLSPIFVDIDPNTLNIDPLKIEKSITKNTTAIMAVHCYGRPCDVDAIQKIADKHNLRVIYDAAHAFGVRCHCGSVLNHGDLSVLSFHATKVFNTFEGGAIICHDPKLKDHIDKLKNFGITSEISVEICGINGKMSEFTAALGLVQLKHIDKAISQRRSVDMKYRDGLQNVKGIKCLENHDGFSNYSYFPILVRPEYSLSRDELYMELKRLGVNSRRYFYPLISSFPLYQKSLTASADKLPVAKVIANQIICLPIYPDLDLHKVHEICSLIVDIGKSKASI